MLGWCCFGRYKIERIKIVEINCGIGGGNCIWFGDDFIVYCDGDIGCLYCRICER